MDKTGMSQIDMPAFCLTLTLKFKRRRVEALAECRRCAVLQVSENSDWLH